MSLDKKTIESAVSLLPIAVDLVGKLVDLAKRAKAEGIEVPTIKKLKELNQGLKELEDL